MKLFDTAKKILACGLVAGSLFTFGQALLPDNGLTQGFLSRVEASEATKDDDGYYCPGPRHGRGRHYRGGCGGCRGYNDQNRPCWNDGNSKE